MRQRVQKIGATRTGLQLAWAVDDPFAGPRATNYRRNKMSKAQDAKKAQKKAATKTPKEKKDAKKAKKEASKRQ